MSTRNSSACNRKSGLEDNETKAERIILQTYLFGILNFKYNRIFLEKCQ